MPISGFTMVFSARLNDIVFARNGAPLPADMSTITGHFWHGATALALTLFIALHIAGAIKDRATIKRTNSHRAAEFLRRLIPPDRSILTDRHSDSKR